MGTEETSRFDETSSRTAQMHPGPGPVVHFVCFDGCSFEAAVEFEPKTGESVRGPNGRRYTVLTVHHYAVPFEYEADSRPRLGANAVCGPFKP
jgi:hypothetical protein